MPEMRMNSLKSRAMNCGPLSEMIRGLASRYLDRKSTRLNSSHSQISYAVFCLKKKKKKTHLVDRYDRDTCRRSHPLPKRPDQTLVLTLPRPYRLPDAIEHYRHTEQAVVISLAN